MGVSFVGGVAVKAAAVASDCHSCTLKEGSLLAALVSELRATDWRFEEVLTLITVPVLRLKRNPKISGVMKFKKKSISRCSIVKSVLLQQSSC